MLMMMMRLLPIRPLFLSTADARMVSKPYLLDVELLHEALLALVHICKGEAQLLPILRQGAEHGGRLILVGEQNDLHPNGLHLL